MKRVSGWFFLILLCVSLPVQAFTKNRCEQACVEGHEGESSCRGKCNQLFTESAAQNVKCHEACSKGKDQCLLMCEGLWNPVGIELP